MKKTKKIQLVLITAALASCNRTLYPTSPASDPGYIPDSTYYAASSDSDSACLIDPSLYDPYAYPYYYTGTYLPGWNFDFFFEWQPVYRSRGILRHRGFIARGGFGKIGVKTAS